VPASPSPLSGSLPQPVRWLLAHGCRIADRLGSRIGAGDARFAGLLDLVEEHVYAGEVTPDGHYVDEVSGR